MSKASAPGTSPMRTVRAHAKGVADEVALGDFGPAFAVGRAGFHSDDVGLLAAHFDGVFDAGGQTRAMIDAR